MFDKKMPVSYHQIYSIPRVESIFANERVKKNKKYAAANGNNMA